MPDIADGPASRRPDPLPELWVGPECTINRIDEHWRDQAELTGFARRADDIRRLATLGARKVRLPVLWERSTRSTGPELDFRWADDAMARLAECGLEPIVGLLHHGSGPRHTSLVDPHFPTLFADYARRVAERYPAQRWWTPINEPLTTARFACLYALWYPHAEDDSSFVRALLNQVQATVLAMNAIRQVNPAACLVQTDDLGFTRCTPGLQDQAAFDNERRWLAFDLLCGRVDRSHALWDWLCACGAREHELEQLHENACPPDIVGINAYVTSERFLDERLHLHPEHLHGGNGRQAYVDIETVRVDGALIDGFAGRLREAHARYGLPIAITEVHMGCTREEQMRWLLQAWQAAVRARAEGIDVRAVTAWAAFGTVDWSSLLTREDEHYEPGLWDIRCDPPRLTALGALASSLARGDAAACVARHPVLAGPGWWQRDLRLGVAPYGALTALPARGAPLLIVGDGALARAFARLSHMRGLPYELLSQAEIGFGDGATLERVIAEQDPWAVVHAGGDEDADIAEGDAAHWRRDVEVPAALAAACARGSRRMLLVSSDLVFPGRDGPHYLEHDLVSPLNAYGRAKAQAERMVLAQLPKALVVRSAGVFGPWDENDFVRRGLALLREGGRWPASHDRILSPTYAPDLVQAALDLLIDGERGVWHLTNGETLSRSDWARRAAGHAGLDPRQVLAVSGVELGQRAPLPRFSGLGSKHGGLLPSLDDALARFLRDHERLPAQPPPLRAVG